MQLLQAFIGAFLISFICSLGGLSGGIILLPFQMIVLGIPSLPASAHNFIYNVMATPLGVMKYIKSKRMLAPLTKVLCLSSVPGVILGVVNRMYFFKNEILFRYFCFALILALSIKLLFSIKKQATKINPDATIEDTSEEKGIISYSFSGDKFEISYKKIAVTGFSVGFVGGMYGIGGAALITPILSGFFLLPVYTISGSTLLANCVNSLVGLIGFVLINFFLQGNSINVDFTMGITMGLAGLTGVYLGTCIQNRVPERIIKYILFVIMLFTAFKLIL